RGATGYPRNILLMENRRQRLFWINILLATALLIMGAVGGFYWWQNRFSTYNNDRYGFSIKYPSDWTVSENTNGAVVLFYSPLENDLDIFQENVNIVVQDISRNKMDVREYTELAIRQMEVVFKDQIETMESEPIYLDDNPAYNYVFVGKGPEGNLKYKSVWTLKDYVAYQVTYTSVESSYDRYVNKVNKMIKSFKIR
ncbi:MAG: hypothetical protein KC684_10560, partial [Candidatus Omnitrophica bacterium]|nr:hypothetical protein [Candidatus Omnitrophota bacterium]